MKTHRLLILCCTLLALPALADERPGTYALIERPLVLPRGTFELDNEVSAAVQPQSSEYFGFTEKLSFDAGLGHHVQLGVWLAVPLLPDSPLYPFNGTLVSRATIELRRNLALRIEAGFDRPTYDPGSTNTAFIALSLVARWRVHPRVTILFGDTGERSEAPTTLAQRGYYTADRYYDSVGSLTGMSQALFALEADRHGVTGSFGAPLGVIVQLHRALALHVTTGVRWQFDSRHFYKTATIPLTLDLVASPQRHVDVGASLSAPLFLDGDGSSAVPIVQTSLFVRARF